MQFSESDRRALLEGIIRNIRLGYSPALARKTMGVRPAQLARLKIEFPLLALEYATAAHAYHAGEN